MAKKILLDRSAAADVKNKLAEAHGQLGGSGIPALADAKRNETGLQKSQVKSISVAQREADKTLRRLEEFSKAYGRYVDEIEAFDQSSAQLLKAAAETAQERLDHWSANPFGTYASLVEMMIADGMSPEEAARLAFAYLIQGLMTGKHPFCIYKGDPINMATGNFIYYKTDFEIPGNYPLKFERFYNAMSALETPLGRNWTHNYHLFVKEMPEHAAIVWEDGHEEHFAKRPDNTFALSTERKKLSRDGKDYLLTTKTGTRYRFAEDGFVRSVADTNGNTTLFMYENGMLARVESQSGAIAFGYGENRLLQSVCDHSGRRVRFAHSEAGDLLGVTQPSGAAYRYEYDEEGRMTLLVNPAGVTALQNTYDARGRTVEQRFADGGCSQMAYDDETMATVATEQNGNVVRYLRDERFRTTGVVYAQGEERFAYNDNNQRTLHVDRNGNRRRYGYDARGNLSEQTDPLGRKTMVSYNEWNRPSRILQANGARVLLSYDDRGNLAEVSDPLKRKSCFAYDERGQVTRVQSPDGSERGLGYDERGNIVCVEDAFGGKTLYAYDALNRVSESADPMGNTTQYEYNERGDITRVTNALGETRTYEYTVMGSVARVVDFDGSETVYAYNGLNRLERIVDAAGGETRFTYDLMWKVDSVTDPTGAQTRYRYDKLGRLCEVTDAEGQTTRYTHDANGNMIGAQGSGGGRARIAYDGLDRAIEVEEADGATTRYSYDVVGNLVKVVDPLGNAALRSYDLAGQLTEEEDAQGRKRRYTYTALGQVKSVTDNEGNTWQYEYAPGGRLQRVIRPGGAGETYEYDANGNVVQVTDGLGNATELSYDSLNRAVCITNALGHSKQLTYDALGNITRLTDEKGGVTRYRYSPLGDVIEVTDALGHSTKYGYDGARRLTRIEQYRLVDGTLADMAEVAAEVTRYERNRRGEVVAVHSPLGEVSRYEYDGAGNVISKTDEEGLETLYAYNAANKLSQVTYADGRTVELSYNALRQLTQVRDWLGTTKVEMDNLGRVEKVTDFEGKTVSYGWDEQGRRERLVYPDGSEVRYGYDALGQLERVQTKEGETRYGYDPLGRIRERELPNGVRTEYGLNALGRLESLTHMRGTKVLDAFRYGYDPAGNITSIDKQRLGVPEDSGLFAYEYDAVNRLTAATWGGERKEYKYDSVGNRIAEALGGQSIIHSYNARNQLIRSDDGEGVTNYNYDRRGNLTEVLRGGILEASYTFGATNMLEKAYSAARGEAEYAYDGLRNRVKRLERDVQAGLDPCAEMRYVLDMTRPYDNLLMTQSADGSMERYTWGNELLGAAGGQESYFYLQDHLHSPIRLVDGGDGQNDTTLAYDEFGVQKVQAGARRNPFGFTGYQLDAVSGLHYAQARYYDPANARMIAEDPIRSGLNWYGYCENNPLMYVDRTGLATTFYRDRNGNWTFLSDRKLENAALNALGIVPFFDSGLRWLGDVVLGHKTVSRSLLQDVLTNIGGTAGIIDLVGEATKATKAAKIISPVITAGNVVYELTSDASYVNQVTHKIYGWGSYYSSPCFDTTLRRFAACATIVEELISLGIVTYEKEFGSAVNIGVDWRRYWSYFDDLGITAIEISEAINCRADDCCE